MKGDSFESFSTETCFRPEYVLSEVSLVTAITLGPLTSLWTVYTDSGDSGFLSNLNRLLLHAQVGPSEMCQGLPPRPLQCNTECTGGTQNDFVMCQKLLFFLDIRYFALDLEKYDWHLDP